jgi:phosphatidylserine synthase
VISRAIVIDSASFAGIIDFDKPTTEKEVLAIDNSRKQRLFLSKLATEYRKSLKPAETEELVNQLVNRPLAFTAAKFFQSVKVGPNLVTILSLLCGVSSGILFARGNSTDALLGAVLLQCMIVFDCADGQLARITNRSSRFGRIIDTFADLATHTSIYWGVAIGLYRTSGSSISFVLALLSQVSMYLHMALFDHFKNVFITVAVPDSKDLLDSLKTMKEQIEWMNTSGSRLSSMVAKMYVWFYRMESIVVSIGYPPMSVNFYERFPNQERIDAHTREVYTRNMRVATKLWTMIGDTIHLEIFVVCGILNSLSLIFPIILIYTNAVMIVALVVQRVKYRKLGLDRKVVWQEEFD